MMNRYRVGLDEVAAGEVSRTGGKGASLARLTAAGFPVPAGFVITTAAYRDAITGAGLEGAAPEDLQARIPAAPIPDEITRQIRSGYAELGSPSVAVRSSGTAEDLADASFAGQHDTYLAITGADAVLAAVRDCWASLWTPRAVAYRRERGIDEAGLSLAVVVQTMVDAEWAGVVFTADPVSGRRDRCLLEAVPGLGEPLVSGQVSGTQYVIDKADFSMTTRRTAVSPPPAAMITTLTRLALEVEQRFAGPQDIEWAYADGRCFLVQARPLTALPDPPAGRSRRRTNDRRQANRFNLIADHLPVPPFPMDVSLVLRPAVGAILRALRSAGFAAPGLDQVLVEIDDGVIQVRPPATRPTRRVAAGLPRALPHVVSLLRTRQEDWRRRSETSLGALVRRIEDADLGARSDGQLIDLVAELMTTAGRLVPSRFACVPGGMIADQLARRLLPLVVGRAQAARTHDDLMAAIPCVTTHANTELRRLARSIRATPELRATYEEEEPARVADRLRGFPGGRRLLEEVAFYLRDYGCRETSIPTVGLPSLGESPQIVHGLLKSLAVAELPEENLDRFPGARRRVREHGWTGWLLGPLILWLTDSGRRAAGFREDSHYRLFTAMAVARNVLLELGGRMAGRGVLAVADDIAYLEFDELRTLPPEQIRTVAERRRAARERALDDYTIVPADLLTTAPRSTAEIRGVPASRGTAVGIARVIRGEREFARLEKGDVLVCPYTNPTWTPLFSLACAVVADVGGAASHAAIVARECGIPAVMGTGNATRLIADGERVLVDADRGIVARLGSGSGEGHDRSGHPLAPGAVGDRILGEVGLVGHHR